LYLTPDYDEHYTVIWALDGRPISSFDGRRVMVFPDSSRAATYGIITREDTVTLARFDNGMPGAQPLQAVLDNAAQPFAQVAQVNGVEGAEGGLDDGQVSWTRLDDFAEMIALPDPHAELEPDSSLVLNLVWRPRQPAAANYTSFVQLVGPENPETGSRVWAQQDGQPGNGTYSTLEWRPGQTIWENVSLRVPPNAPPGEYTLLTGMYLLDTGERVPLYRNGSRLPDDALAVRTFTLE
jgi:hypothetical protein